MCLTPYNDREHTQLKGVPSMLKNVLFVACGLLISSAAVAQEYGALVGVHQTTADTDQDGLTVDGKLGFKLGLAVAFDLTDTGKFRTGLLYNQRHFEISATGVSVDAKYDWIDIPALYQHKFTDMFSAYGGLVIGLNVSDKTDPDVGDVEIESMIPLIEVGANLMFDDMMGFDFYYQRGLGDISEGYMDYSTFGANFLYWF